MGGSPSLVVMVGDSCNAGCGFKSQHRGLDWHFSHIFVVKIVMFVWKDENKQKEEAGDGPLKQSFVQHKKSDEIKQWLRPKMQSHGGLKSPTLQI